MDIRFDPDDLTLGDLEDFEEHTGKPIQDALKPTPVFEHDDETGERKRKYDDQGRPVSEVRVSAKDLVTLVWLIKRKDDPSFTLKDARAVRVTSLTIINAEDEADEVEDIKSRGNG